MRRADEGESALPITVLPITVLSASRPAGDGNRLGPGHRMTLPSTTAIGPPRHLEWHSSCQYVRGVLCLVRLVSARDLTWTAVLRVELAQPSSASMAAAAFSPDRTAPSMYPHQTGEVSVPAQWIGPAGVVSACPYLVHTFGPNSVP